MGTAFHECAGEAPRETVVPAVISMVQTTRGIRVQLYCNARHAARRDQAIRRRARPAARGRHSMIAPQTSGYVAIACPL